MPYFSNQCLDTNASFRSPTPPQRCRQTTAHALRVCSSPPVGKTGSSAGLCPPNGLSGGSRGRMIRPAYASLRTETSTLRVCSNAGAAVNGHLRGREAVIAASRRLESWLFAAGSLLLSSSIPTGAFHLSPAIYALLAPHDSPRRGQLLLFLRLWRISHEIQRESRLLFCAFFAEDRG
jgi:hypothetical protein